MPDIEEQVEMLLVDYSLEEILEYCDLPQREALIFLVENGIIELPEWTPRW